MRRAALAAIAAVLVSSSRAVPADAEGWYTPPEWSFPGWAAQWSQDGQDYVCMVDNKGKIEWGDKMPSNVAVKKAVEEAVAARCEAVKLQDQIKTLGENLAALDWDKMLAEVEDTSSGATASGSVERKIDRLVIAADGLLSGGLAPDGVSVVTNDAGKLALANIPAKLVVPEVFPYWNGEALGWTALADLLDGKSLGVEPKADAAPGEDYLCAGIRGWGSQGGCGERLSDMLTDPDKADLRGKHELLCRFGGTKEGVIHYLPIGDVIQSGGAALEVVGTDGGKAVCTNRLIFASAPDSNVKFTVTDEGSGSVKITVGVYYK